VASRIHSLDALRGLAVMLMLEQHLGVWLWRGPSRGETVADYYPLVVVNAVGGFGAPLFIGLAGVGSALMCAKARPGLDATLVKRGACLWAFGVVLNLVTPSWFSWGSFFALHVMGVSMMLTPLLRRLSNRGLLVALGGVLIATAFVQHAFETPLRLSNDRMRDMTLPGGALRLALAESQYPILPWTGVFIGGLLAGRDVLAGRFAGLAMRGVWAAVVGAGLFQLYAHRVPPFGAPVLRRALDIHMGFFPASVSIVLLLLGATLVLVAATAWYDTRRPLSATNPLVTLGRASLTLFLLHVWLFREATRPIGLWQSLPAGQAWAGIVGTIVVAVVLTRLWQRVDYRYGAEWLLRKLAG
jgi:uncharacterized membrane protein